MIKPASKPIVKGCRLRGNSYYLDKIVRGVHLTECVGPDPKLAEAALALRINQIWEGSYFPNKRESSLTITDVLSTYWDEKLQFTSSGDNRKFHLTKLRKELGDVIALDLDIARVEKHCRKRLSERREIKYKKPDGTWAKKLGNPITPRTVNAEIVELFAALTYAVKNRRLKFNPIAAFKKIEEPEPEKVMLDDGHENGSDWKRLYNAASNDLKPIIECQYLTGMRIGEVLCLRWCWIDLTDGNIHLPANVTKTRKKRDVPISPELQRLLLSIEKRSDTDLVFPNNEGTQRKSIRKAFDGAVIRAGWDRGYFTTHALRRTRGQIWDQVDRHLSCRALGHDEKIHDEHYTKVTPEMLKVLVQRKAA